MELNAEFVKRTESLFGKDVYARFMQALDEEPVVSIRHNGLKRYSGTMGDDVPWASTGCYLAERPVFTADPLFHAGHRERLKEKLLDNKLTSYEKLELLLTYAIPRRDVRPVARTLLKRFRSVYCVLNATIEDLETVPGVGRNTALLIHLVHELMMISYREQMEDGDVLVDPGVIKEYCRKMLIGKSVEEFHVLYLELLLLL